MAKGSILTETKIKTLKPGEKTKKVFDSHGLYLEVSPAGGKWWRLKYRYAGKEKRLSLGVYPEVGLKDAREQRDEMRRLLRQGVDPSQNRQSMKASQQDRSQGSFEVVAREWFQKYSKSWAPNHADRIIQRLERDIFPWLGTKTMEEIKAPELLSVIRKIESRGAVETAHRALGNCGQIFRYAVATGRATRDIAPDLRGALQPTTVNHFAAVIEPSRVAELLRAFDDYEGSFVVKCALKLAPMVFVRPGELRSARWADMDLEVGRWTYLVSKTKTQHIVPLSRQAVELLQELQPLTGNGAFVFPSARSRMRPMSDNAILAAMRRLGIPKDEMTGHGFRAMARTILDEVLGFRPDFIEHQLAHAVKDPNGRAYNRTAHIAERTKMMQAWADYLDQLKVGAVVIKMPQGA